MKNTETLTDKLLDKGMSYLTDAELLSMLIATNKPEGHTLQQAKTILADCDYSYRVLERQGSYDLQSKGLTKQQSVKVLVSQEISRRAKIQKIGEKPKINGSLSVYTIMQPVIGHLNYEEFWILYLSSNNRVMKKVRHTKGVISGTLMDVRLILRDALNMFASSIIICHNHTSDNTQPSEADIKMTRKMRDACTMMDITLLDHVIIAGDKHYSFADKGELS